MTPDKIDCPHCGHPTSIDGDGIIQGSCTQCPANGAAVCPDCDGVGEVDCEACGGNGYIEATP